MVAFFFLELEEQLQRGCVLFLAYLTYNSDTL